MCFWLDRSAITAFYPRCTGAKARKKELKCLKLFCTIPKEKIKMFKTVLHHTERKN
jgi:hypothetical protein